MAGVPAGITEPLIFTSTILFDAFDVTVIFLSNIPIRILVSYFTLKFALAPGAIGFLGQLSGNVVQPQAPFILAIVSGVFPVFLNENVRIASLPCVIFPKSITSD